MSTINLKIKGITRTWIVNIFMLVVLLVLAFEIVMGFVFQNFYYNSVITQLTELTGNYANFTGITADSSIESEAHVLTDKFENKNIAEMQVYDTKGTVVMSTSGFILPGSSLPPDYVVSLEAFNNGDDQPSPYIGRGNYTEKVMASTVIIKNPDGGHMGAVRFVISLHDIDMHIMSVMMIMILVGVGVILFVLMSGLYFVNSIIKPVQAVNTIARRIALGDFESRIEIKKENEIGELCDTINYMAGELRAAETMKNDFISSVSHELRTPLTAIKGWGETVRSSIGTDEVMVEKGMSVIIKESERLSGLVEELLDFSRMQSGHFSFDIKRIDLLAELLEAVYIYEEIGRRNGVSIKYSAPDTVLALNGDAARIKQVFINVIDNAVKYSKADGVIIIDVALENNCARITVSDNGVGIPATDVERVKEKFYKANKTVRGSGIGLAVADEIIKQHKGLLLLDSIEGEGTTVTIVLPIEPPAAKADEPVPESTGEITESEQTNERKN